MPPVIFYTDHHVFPLPEGHRFPIRKYRMLRKLLEQDGRFDLQPAPLADPAIIEFAHDPQYVTDFISGALPATSMRRIGFPWSEQLVERTLASVGGTLAATRIALQYGFGGTLAGGTHHAFRAEGAGYCVFNDIAVAIESLRHRSELRPDSRILECPTLPAVGNVASTLGPAALHRFAVVDLDVHQGDGTAQIFEEDPDVLTFSMHGSKNFPFRKQRSKIDIELQDGTSDAEYLAQLEQALPHVLDFRPEIIFYQAGVDPLDSDRLGRLQITMQGLRRRDELVFNAVGTAGLPIVVTLGGGYSDPIERTAEAHAQTFRSALAFMTP